MSNLKQLQKELERKGYNIKFASEIKEEQKIRTGVFALDYVLGGGISLCEGGHRIELYGAESTAKTTLALQVAKKYQELNKLSVFINAEKDYDKAWAEVLGVKNDKMLIVNVDTLEQCGDVLTTLIPKVDLIILNGIVSLICEEEIERETNEPTMALAARVNALITRKIYNAIGNRTTTLIFINQLRERVGQLYGDPFTRGGGRALKHFYSTSIYTKAGKNIELGKGENKEIIGKEIILKCVKNKKGVPNRVASFDFYFDGKIDNIKSLLHQAIRFGIIKQSGAWVEYKNTKVQGKEKLIESLTEKDWKEIEEEIWKNLK